MARPRGAETILLVEDEIPVRELIRSQLEGLGYSVREASNGTEALGLAKNNSRPFDLLITDMHMANMGGQELTERILESCPGIKIVQVTGYNEASQPSANPVIQHLQKPFTLEELAAAIRRALDK
jgi:CheY-like chemotaxis protein